MKKIIIVASALITPFMVFAQSSLGLTISMLRQIGNTFLPVLMLIAFAIFFLGIIRRISAAGDKEKAQAARKYIIYGIVGFIVAIPLWSILQIFGSTFGFTPGQGTITAPTIGFGGSSYVSSDSRNYIAQEKSGTGQQFNTAQAQEGDLTQRKIIKNGSLSLLVKKIEETTDSIRTLASNYRGFVADMKINESSSGMKNGTITIRVPAERFDEIMASLKNLAIKVESENSTSQDVTEQFIDLEARLRSLRAQEEQYLEIMKRAFAIQEVLNVQQRLGDVRGQIEKIQGQLQFLSRQIDMSTISISLKSEADLKIFGIYWRPMAVVKESFYNLLRGLADYADEMIIFIFFLPRLALWLATIIFCLYIAWRIFFWLKPKFLSLRSSFQQNKQNQ